MSESATPLEWGDRQLPAECRRPVRDDSSPIRRSCWRPFAVRARRSRPSTQFQSFLTRARERTSPSFQRICRSCWMSSRAATRTPVADRSGERSLDRRHGPGGRMRPSRRGRTCRWRRSSERRRARPAGDDGGRSRSARGQSRRSGRVSGGHRFRRTGHKHPLGARPTRHRHPFAVCLAALPGAPAREHPLDRRRPDRAAGHLDVQRRARAEGIAPAPRPPPRSARTPWCCSA